MEIIFKGIFGILCGILYVIGLVCGLNYEEISVYICIYLWPLLIILSTFPLIYESIKKIILVKNKLFGSLFLILSSVYSYTYVLIFGSILEHYNIKYSIHQLFKLCYNDLIEISYNCKMSYEQVNLIIYCELFLTIILINFILYKLLRVFH